MDDGCVILLVTRARDIRRANVDEGRSTLFRCYSAFIIYYRSEQPLDPIHKYEPPFLSNGNDRQVDFAKRLPRPDLNDPRYADVIVARR
jgi:hypothetical protein